MSLTSTNMTASELAAWEAQMRGETVAVSPPVARERRKPLRAVPASVTVPQEPTDHAHHWVIAEPDGSHERPGRCKHCGTERMFRIGESDDRWNPGDMESRRRGGDTQRRKVRA